MSKKNLLKPLSFVALLLSVCVTLKAQILTESFDAVSFPPSGWTNVHSGGTNTLAIWSRDTAGALLGDDEVASYVYIDPHSGAGLAQFTSYDFSSGNSAYLASPAIDLSGTEPKVIKFWMYRDGYYQSRPDSVSVFLNNAQSLSGANFIGKVTRPKTSAPVQNGADGWYQYSFNIPAGLNLANSYLIIKGTSAFGNNISIDDVSVEINQQCTGVPAGGAAASDANLLCTAGTVNLSLSGASTADGVVYQWESAPGNTTDFTAIAGATEITYQATINATTTYRAKVLCTATGSFVYSAPITIELTGIPANDEACGAIVLTDGGAAQCGNTTCATSNADDPAACFTPNNTVWYKFTPASNGIYNITMKRPASGSDFLDAWVDIFTATGTCPTLTFTRFTPDCLNADLISDSSAIVTTPALTAGTDYYIRLDGVSGAFGTYCISIAQAPLPPACTTNLLPANGATNVGVPVLFSWSSAAGANNYTLFVGTTNPLDPVADSVLDVSDTSISLIGFAANTTYYWYVTPKNSGGAATGCDANVSSFTTAAGPGNDACGNAVPLTVSNGFCANPVLGTLTLSDSTAGLPRPDCQTGSRPNDVWYQVTVPATGNVTIQSSAVNTSVTDVVIQAYSGTCGSLTPIGCDDDGNPDPAPSAYHSKLGLSNRTPGEIIYIRIMPYSSINQGAFAICAFDTSASVMPPVSNASNGSSCTQASAVNIDSAFKYGWVTFTEIGSNNIIASVYPNGNILGLTNASFYKNTSGTVRTSGNDYYLDRNITITPTNQPAAQNLPTTRLYFTEAELAALSAAAGGATRTDLNVTKTSQACPNSALVGSNGVFIAQSGNGAYLNDNYVDVQNSSYSTFYLHKGNTVVPVTLAIFNAQRTGRVNSITWSAAQELDVRNYIIERSTDGRTFIEIGQVAANGRPSTQQDYSFIDMSPVKGINYYRLRIVDADGRIKYSAVKNVRNEGTADVALYPNPVNNLLRVNINSDVTDKASVTICDLDGRLVYVAALNIVQGSNYSSINVDRMSKGTYIIKIQLNNDLVVRKFNKL